VAATNPLLDFALGTAVVPKEVELPPNYAPAWLHDAGGAFAGVCIRDRLRTNAATPT
jgi:hypothetical protein